MKEETRKEKSARKRLVLIIELKNMLLETFDKEMALNPDGAWKRSCNIVDNYINELIRKTPQEKSIIIDSASEFAKYLDEVLDKIIKQVP